VEISEKLLCLFSAEVSDDGDSYVVEVPRREVDTGSIQPGETYRVALIAADESEEATEDGGTSTAPTEPQPPVEGGEIRYVEIEDIGKQGTASLASSGATSSSSPARRSASASKSR